MSRRRIAIAAGGTMGHITPAPALAAAWHALDPAAEVLFLGTPAGYESEVLPRLGHDLRLVRGEPLYGRGPLQRARALAELGVGVAQARQVLREHGSRIVVGLGCYACAPAILAGRSLGLVTALHEANAIPGFTNRLLGRVVDRVYAGFDSVVADFPRGRTRVVGNPVRPEIVAAGSAPRARPAGAPPWRLLVTGGSHGSGLFNARLPVVAGRLLAAGHALRVEHQAGGGDGAAVRAAYAAAGVEAEVDRWFLDMPARLAAADFVVARAGAYTMAEIAACGLPALVVPDAQAAEGHQLRNADLLARAGGLWTLREEAWDDEAVAAGIARLLGDAAAWERQAAAARRCAAPDAARALVEDCERLMAGRW